MSRLFSKNSSNYMSLGANTFCTLFNKSAALSFHAWINVTSLGTAAASNNRIFSVRMDTNRAIQMTINATGTPAVLRLFASSQSSDTERTLGGVALIGTGRWISVGCVTNFAAGSLQLYVDGLLDATADVSFGSGVLNSALTATVHDAIGGDGNTPSTAAQIDGMEAEFSAWNYDVGQSAFDELASGILPTDLVSAGEPTIYFPLTGQYSPENDIISGKAGTITGTIAIGEHPPVRLRSRSHFVVPAPGKLNAIRRRMLVA